MPGKKGIGSGELFLTTGGRRLDRRQIWAKMKALCGTAGVAREKVFPHNLRHLFARCFYRASHDISALANMLGHSSIETTRIYLVSTEDVYAKKNSPPWAGAADKMNILSAFLQM
mgnify:CR=1 FL=1